jgi:hypothetical protein
VLAPDSSAVEAELESRLEDRLLLFARKNRSNLSTFVKIRRLSGIFELVVMSLLATALDVARGLETCSAFIYNAIKSEVAVTQVHERRLQSLIRQRMDLSTDDSEA